MDVVQKKSWFWSTCRDLTLSSITVAGALLMVGFLATILVSSRSISRIDEANRADFGADSQEAANNFKKAIELEVREFELDLIHLETTHPSTDEKFLQFFDRVAVTGNGADFPYLLVEPVDDAGYVELMEREAAINPGKGLDRISISPNQSIVVTRSTVSQEAANEVVTSGLSSLTTSIGAIDGNQTLFVEAKQRPEAQESTPSGYLVGPVRNQDGSVMAYLAKPITVADILRPVTGSSFSRVNAAVTSRASGEHVFSVINDPEATLDDARYRTSSDFEASGLVWTITTWNTSEIASPPMLVSPSFEWLSGASGTISLALAWLMWSARDRRATDATREVQIAQELAFTDRLTGLLNRGGLFEAAKNLGTVRATLFFIDLNHFKVVNDTYGHEAGDRVLVAVAEALRETTRSIDKVARVGGDEFVVIMPGLADRRRAVRLARSIERRIAVMKTGVTASVGVASSLPDEPLNMDDLIKRADSEMYQRKQEYHSNREGTPKSGPMGSAPSWMIGNS